MDTYGEDPTNLLSCLHYIRGTEACQGLFLIFSLLLKIPVFREIGRLYAKN